VSDWYQLTASDFPLVAIGPNVYRRTMSSPLLTAPSDELAEDLASRLNDHETRKLVYVPNALPGPQVSPVFVSVPVQSKI